MITSMNKVLIMGRVESDPDYRQVGDNNSDKLGFRVRTERAWKERTFSTVHRIVAWGAMAAQNKGLRAGSAVMVDGRLDNRKYEVDGETKWISEVVANDIQVYGEGEEKKEEEEEEIPF